MADDNPRAIKAIALPEGYDFNLMAMGRTAKFNDDGTFVMLMLHEDGSVRWFAATPEGEDISQQKIEEWTETLEANRIKRLQEECGHNDQSLRSDGIVQCEECGKTLYPEEG